MPTSTQRFRLVGEDDASRAFLQVAAASKLLKSNIDDVNSSLFGLGKLMGGTSLIPVIAGASAAVVELTTSLGAASLAGGVFGLSVVGQVKSMAQQQKSIGQTEVSLSKLAKGTTQYADTLTALHQQQKAFNQQFGPAAKGFNQMSDSWGKFLHSTAPVTNGVLAKGLGLVASVLPKLVPVSNAAGKAIGGLIDEMISGVDGPGFAHFLHFLETSGPKDITAFGHIVGNVVGGLGGILSNFVGPGDHAAATLERLTKNFDKWGHSKGVSQGVNHFLKYVSENSPAIQSSLGSLAEATPKIASALGKLGSANLTLTSKFLSLVAGLPQKQFNLIADGLFAMAAGSKALTAVTGLGAVAKGLAGIAGGKGLTGGGGGGILGGVGVQKVYVVNMGQGGMGGPGGSSWESKAGKIAKYAGPGTVVGAGLGIAGVTAIALAAVIGTVKYFQIASKPGAVNVGGMNASQTKQFNNDRMAQMYGANWNGPIKAASNHLDALNAKLTKSSRNMDLVGNHADAAFNGKAVRGVQNATYKLQKLSGVKAEQAFDLVGHSAQRAGQVGGAAVDGLSSKINHLPNKNVRINADTGQAQASIQALIASISRVHDKTVHINSYTNATIAEHVTGPADHKHKDPQSKSAGSSAGPGGGGGGGNHPNLLNSLVGRGRMSLSHILDSVRGAKATGRSRLQATIASRNAYVGGFQNFATSAFGADYGTNADTGEAIAPTIGSILAQAQGQASQAAMVKHDVRRLVKLGLSPALLKQLQAAGAAGIPEIEALAGASRSQIAQYNHLNKQTSSDLRSAGMSAGQRIYGQQIRREEKHNAAIEHLLKQLVDMAKHHPDKLVAELKGDHIDLILRNERRRKGKLQSDKKS